MTMEHVDPLLLGLLVVVVLAGAIVNGLIGMGFALVTVNVIAAALGTKEAIIVISALGPPTAIYQFWRFRTADISWRRLQWVLVASLAGSVVGAQLLVLLPAWVISIALGALTLQLVVDVARRERPPMAVHRERLLGPVAGFLGGAANGALGASGPITGSFLLAIGLRGRDFVFAASLIFLAQGLTRAGLFAAYGQYTQPLLLTTAALLVPALVGQQIGIRLHGRVDARMFQRILLLVLFFSSANLLWRGIGGALDAARAAGLIG